MNEIVTSPPIVKIPNIWVSSDFHFGHKNIIEKFQPPRPFATVEEMNEAMVERHNAKVKENDKFYCLGDIAFSIKVYHQYMPRLNGKKRLILGNHDNFRMDEYYKYFEKIMLWRPFGEFKTFGVPLVLTHIPCALECARPPAAFIVNGHVHFRSLPNPRYINVCQENINYTPVHLEEIVDYAKKNNSEIFTKPTVV